MAVPVTPEHPKVPEDEWTNGTTTEGDKSHKPTEKPVEPVTPIAPKFTALTPNGYCTDWIYPSDNTRTGGYDDVSTTAE
jgi:hypothetical protein